MQLTNIKIQHTEDTTTKLRAIVDLVINNNMLVKGLKIMRTQKGYSVACPTKNPQNAYGQILAAIYKKARMEWKEQILQTYLQEVK